MEQANTFLAKKEQVRITLTLKGRQKAHPERGVDFLNGICETYFSETGRCVNKPSVSSLNLTLMPKK